MRVMYYQRNICVRSGERRKKGGGRRTAERRATRPTHFQILYARRQITQPLTAQINLDLRSLHRLPDNLIHNPPRLPLLPPRLLLPPLLLPSLQTLILPPNLRSNRRRQLRTPTPTPSKHPLEIVLVLPLFHGRREHVERWKQPSLSLSLSSPSP